MHDLKNKTIIVTGGAGFLGKKVVDRLKCYYPKEIIIPRSDKCDLTNKNSCSNLLQKTNPDIIIHLAAEVGGIGANKEHPGRFFYANLSMGMNLIEESRINCPNVRFVQVGTICSYPKFCNVPFSEDKIWDGFPEETNAPYGIAKKSLLVMLQSYRQEYGFNGIYLLPVNLYGPGDNFDLQTSHVIPAIIRKMVEAKKSGGIVELWGDGSPSREFLYVDDAAEGIVLATIDYDSDEPCNIGTGFEISIKELVELIQEEIEFDGKVVWDDTKPNGQPRRCLNIDRARSFGFSARTSLKEGIKNTIKWYIENQ